jgi:hypothetical protein
MASIGYLIGPGIRNVMRRREVLLELSQVTAVILWQSSVADRPPNIDKVRSYDGEQTLWC